MAWVYFYFYGGDELIKNIVSIVPTDPVQSEYRDKEERQSMWQRENKALSNENDVFAEILVTAIKRKKLKEEKGYGSFRN